MPTGFVTVRVERPVRVERVRARFERDRRAAFGGELPKRQRGETASAYERRVEAVRQEDKRTRYDWSDFDSFMDSVDEEGLSEHDGYDIWYGY